MLKLSRKQGERIIIEGVAVISIEKIKGSVVSVGIEAPQSIKIWREEICQARKSSSSSEATDK